VRFAYSPDDGREEPPDSLKLKTTQWSYFFREGMRKEHRIASMRHAEAAITYGQDDATALTFAGFTIGMEGRDRATALCARFFG
jgi:hypothetical protein